MTLAFLTFELGPPDEAAEDSLPSDTSPGRHIADGLEWEDLASIKP